MKLESSGHSRTLLIWETKPVLVHELYQEGPSFWGAMEEALHQESKTAHRTLPFDDVLSALALSTGNT